MTETIDALGDQLVRTGLVANHFVLDLNHGLTVPAQYECSAPWDLPSRMFRFPIVVSEPIDGVRRMGLRHPLLADHPWVQHVQNVLGIQIEPGGIHNRHGVSLTGYAQWWHAVDLISAGKWRALIATRRFTTDGDIAGAVGYGLQHSPHDGDGQCGYISSADARKIMAALDEHEPIDRGAGLRLFDTPRPCSSEKGVERWPVNNEGHPTPAAEAWALIHGIESGWLKHDRSGFLGWTQAGRDRFAAGEGATFTEATGQGAFAF